MRIYRQTSTFSSIVRRAFALLAVAAVLTSTFATFPTRAWAQNERQPRGTRLSEDQRILHVLNRLGFGARPGDVEHVKAIGLDNYITQQLNPEKISDAVADAKVKNLATLSMTTAELYEKFPQPGQLLKQLQRHGELPADLADAEWSAATATNHSRAAGFTNSKSRL